MEAQLDLVLRIAMAGAIAGLVGLERELRGHDPGIRTHAVVAVGAALFTVAGAYGFTDLHAGAHTDPTRIAAQVAAGIGFIGAGAMLRSGLSVRGVTTAATLWLSAAIGVAAGAALYWPLLGALLVSIAVLIGVRVLKPRVVARFPSRQRVLNIEYRRGHGTLGPVMRGLRTINCHVADLALDDDDDECSTGAGLRRARLAIHVADESALVGFVRTVHRRPEVLTVSVDPPAPAVRVASPAGDGAIAGASNTEVELQYRYRGAPREIVPIELAGLPLTRSKRVDLVDTYFDTDQLALRRAHCSLRIRREDDRAPRLVWKGPPRHRPDGAKAREERQIPLAEHSDGSDVTAMLVTTGLADLVAGLLGPAACGEIRSIGELRNERSVHTYGADGRSLELVWDRLQYPTGPAETRLEVEAGNADSVELLAEADEQLRQVLGRDLETSPRGKARELCARLQAAS